MQVKIVAAGLLTLTCAGVGWAAGVAIVDQKGLAFSKETLDVSKGTIVQFTNSDTTPHNILITHGADTIDGGLQQPGSVYKVPFAQEGTYDITCAIHPKMHMSVKVQ